MSKRKSEIQVDGSVFYLKLQEQVPTHISHFMRLVSAYEITNPMVQDLAEKLREGLTRAKETVHPVIVDQDTIDFFFLCFPSGSIGLYCRMGMYEAVTIP